jgi:hypothetical protein
MNRLFLVITAAMAMTILSPTFDLQAQTQPPLARCSPADLARRPWSLFAMESEGGQESTVNCTLAFNEAGGILLTSRCVTNTGETFLPRGGPITVLLGCRVRGQYRRVIPDGEEFVCSIDGAMSPGKHNVAGVGRCGPEVISLFYMIIR